MMLQFTFGVITFLYCCILNKLNADIYPKSDTVKIREWGPTWVYVEWKQPPSFLPLYGIEVIGTHGNILNHSTTEIHFNVTDLTEGGTYNLTVRASPRSCNLTDTVSTVSTVSTLGAAVITTQSQKAVELEVSRFYRKGDPNKYFIPVGLTINVTCSLTSSAYDVKDLIFKPKGNTIVERRSIWRTFVMKTPRHPYIACCLDECDDVTGHQQNTDSAVFNVGYPPGEVEGFSCYSVVLTNLVCTWSVESQQTTDVDWSAEYTIHRGDTGRAVSTSGQCDVKTFHCINWYCPCEIQQENNHFRCEVKGVDFLVYFTYTISILGNNNFGTTAYSGSVFANESIATYSRPRSAMVVEEGPSWLLLSWHEPVDIGLLFGSTPIYNISISGNGKNNWIITTQRSHNVTMLKPFCNYTFGVTVKPDKSSIWSESTYLTHRTLEDRPGASPLLSQSGFTWWSRGTFTYLTVYWKSMPSTLSNGPLMGYSLCLDCDSDELVPLQDTLNTSNIAHVKTTGNSYTWRIRTKSSTHRVDIRARNSAGYSDPSTLFTPSYESVQRLHVGFVTVEHISPSSYNISWLTSHPNVKNITVTWSLGLDPTHSSLFGWEVYPHNASYVIMNTTLEPPSSRNISLYFGIALMSGNQSGGITWSHCIFTDTRVDKAPGLLTTATDTEITVQWNFTYCEGNIVTVPAYYNVTNMTITSLDQSSTYCVCMRVIYTWGQGPVSSPLEVKLNSTLKHAWSLIGGVIGGSVAAIVLVIMSVVYVRTHGKNGRTDKMYRPCKQNSSNKEALTRSRGLPEGTELVTSTDKSRP